MFYHLVKRWKALGDKMFNDIIDSIINNASNEEIEIIREKLNNHLINHIYDSNIHEELSNNYDSSFCQVILQY